MSWRTTAIGEYGEFIIFLRDADDHIGDSLVDSGIFRYKEYHIGTSRLYLTDVGDGLREDVFLGRDGDPGTWSVIRAMVPCFNSPAA